MGRRGACAVRHFPARRSFQHHCAERVGGWPHKLNHFSGKVWFIKTNAKPVARIQARVLVARAADFEKTRELSAEDFQTFAMEQTASPADSALL